MKAIKKRPATVRGGSTCTTPHTAQLIALLGGISHKSVTISEDERRAIERLYGFEREAPRTKLDALDKWTDPRPFYQAGADIALMRYAERDGLRLVAWLAKHIEPGADPLKTLVDLASASGWDVDPSDVEWAQGSGEGEE